MNTSLAFELVLIAYVPAAPAPSVVVYYTVICVTALVWFDRRHRIHAPASFAFLAGIIALSLDALGHHGAKTAWNEMFFFLHGRVDLTALFWYWALPLTLAFALRLGHERIRALRRPGPVPSAIPVCSVCGYDRRASKSRICPECGSQIRPGRTRSPRARFALQAILPSVVYLVLFFGVYTCREQRYVDYAVADPLLRAMAYPIYPIAIYVEPASAFAVYALLVLNGVFWGVLITAVFRLLWAAVRSDSSFAGT